MQGGTGYTTERDVMLAISGEDVAGVSEMILGEDSTFANAVWEPYATNRLFTLSEGDGTKTVYMRLKDSGDHVSELITTEIGYETRPPGAPVLSVLQGAYTPTRNISVKAASDSAVAPMRWALISEATDFAGSSWQDFGVEMPFTLSAGEGTKTIYAKFRDSAGNESETVSTTTMLDLTLPTTPVISNMPRRVEVNSETIDITTASTDTFFKSYVVRGCNYTDWTEVKPPIVFTLANVDSWYNLEVRGKDLAGNMSESATIRLFRGSQTILDGSAAQLTGDASRGSSAAPATLSSLYTPYLLRGSSESPTFADYNLSIEAGTELRVTEGLNVWFTGLTVTGEAAKHVTLTSANSSKGPGDWLELKLDGALDLNYFDVAHYTYASLAKGATATSITDSSFTNFSNYGLRDYAGGSTNIVNTLIRCPALAVSAGYYTSTAVAGSSHAFSKVQIQNCQVGMYINGPANVTMTSSNVYGNTTNVRVSTTASGVITLTGDYFGYGTTGGTLANLHISDSDTLATVTYVTTVFLDAGPR